jgi:hypothetical protein
MMISRHGLVANTLSWLPVKAVEREMGLIISYKKILVFDIHHKPRGLTSLSRCYLSQVHKVQHKPRKN